MGFSSQKPIRAVSLWARGCCPLPPSSPFLPPVFVLQAGHASLNLAVPFDPCQGCQFSVVAAAGTEGGPGSVLGSCWSRGDAVGMCCGDAPSLAEPLQCLSPRVPCPALCSLQRADTGHVRAELPQESPDPGDLRRRPTPVQGKAGAEPAPGAALLPDHCSGAIRDCPQCICHCQQLWLCSGAVLGPPALLSPIPGQGEGTRGQGQGGECSGSSQGSSGERSQHTQPGRVADALLQEQELGGKNRVSDVAGEPAGTVIIWLGQPSPLPCPAHQPVCCWQCSSLTEDVTACGSLLPGNPITCRWTWDTEQTENSALRQCLCWGFSLDCATQTHIAVNLGGSPFMGSF